MIPGLLFLIYLGGFAVKNSFGDMLVVLLFGALGWFMVKFDWQRPPLLLGLVLGGIAENNLFIANRIYGYSWLWHPGVLVIGFIILAGTLYPYLQARLRGFKEKTEPPTALKQTSSIKTVRLPLGTRMAQTVFASFMVGIFAYVVYEAKFGFGAFEPRAALFPWVIGVPSLTLALYVFAKEALASTRQVKVGEMSLAEIEPEIDPIVERHRTVSIVFWIVGFFIAIWILGFVPASAVATLLYLKFGAGEKWPITLALSVACWLFFFGVFDFALNLPFPAGAFFDWVHVTVPPVRNLFAAIG